jgi:hypothetical protein
VCEDWVGECARPPRGFEDVDGGRREARVRRARGPTSRFSNAVDYLRMPSTHHAFRSRIPFIHSTAPVCPLIVTKKLWGEASVTVQAPERAVVIEGRVTRASVVPRAGVLHAGRRMVPRSLYRATRNGKVVDPIALRVGTMEGGWLPDTAAAMGSSRGRLRLEGRAPMRRDHLSSRLLTK